MLASLRWPMQWIAKRSRQLSIFFFVCVSDCACVYVQYLAQQQNRKQYAFAFWVKPDVTVMLSLILICIVFSSDSVCLYLVKFSFILSFPPLVCLIGFSLITYDLFVFSSSSYVYISPPFQFLIIWCCWCNGHTVMLYLPIGMPLWFSFIKVNLFIWTLSSLSSSFVD